MEKVKFIYKYDDNEEVSFTSKEEEYFDVEKMLYSFLRFYETAGFGTPISVSWGMNNKGRIEYSSESGINIVRSAEEMASELLASLDTEENRQLDMLEEIDREERPICVDREDNVWSYRGHKVEVEYNEDCYSYAQFYSLDETSCVEYSDYNIEDIPTFIENGYEELREDEQI